MQIWKFTLEVYDETRVSMPVGARILTVQAQMEQPCIWAICNPTAEREWRHFRIYGTGQDMPDNPGVYVGTFQLHGGRAAFHLFDGGLIGE